MEEKLYEMFTANFPDDGKGMNGDRIYRWSAPAIVYGSVFILLGFITLVLTHGLKQHGLSEEGYWYGRFFGAALCIIATVWIGPCYIVVRLGIGMAHFNGRQQTARSKHLLRSLDAVYWLVMGAGVSSLIEVKWPLNSNSLVFLLGSFVLFCGTITLASKYATAIIVFKVLYVTAIVTICATRAFPETKKFVSVLGLSATEMLKSKPSSDEQHDAAARVIQGMEADHDEAILGQLYSEALRIRQIITQNKPDQCRERQVAELKSQLSDMINHRKPDGVPVPGCEPTSDYWVGRREEAIVVILAGRQPTVKDDDVLGAVLPDVVELGRLRGLAAAGRLTRCESKRLLAEETIVSHFKATGKFDARSFKLKACAAAPQPVNDEQDSSSGFGSDEGHIE
jgi:hypothetical protein